MQLKIEVDVAAAMLDTAEALSGPISQDEVMLLMRQARFLVHELLLSFEQAGIDPDDITRPEYPLLRPGSKFTGTEPPTDGACA